MNLTHMEHHIIRFTMSWDLMSSQKNPNCIAVASMQAKELPSPSHWIQRDYPFRGNDAPPFGVSCRSASRYPTRWCTLALLQLYLSMSLEQCSLEIYARVSSMVISSKNGERGMLRMVPDGSRGIEGWHWWVQRRGAYDSRLVGHFVDSWRIQENGDSCMSRTIWNDVLGYILWIVDGRGVV